MKNDGNGRPDRGRELRQNDRNDRNDRTERTGDESKKAKPDHSFQGR